MASPKRKLEVVFKTDFHEEKQTEPEIRAFLEEKFPWIKIKNIELYQGKSSTKAVVSSNLASYLASLNKAECI